MIHYFLGLLVLCSLPNMLWCQHQQKKKIQLYKIEKTDTVYQPVYRTQPDAAFTIPVIDENSLKENIDADAAPVLNAVRDPVKSVIAFQFSALRFQQKGLGSNYSVVTVNGVPMMDPATGTGLWSNWSGLNDVFRINETGNGLQQNSYAVAAMGESSNMDIRASKQRPQTSFGYGFSNRSFSHRIMLTHSTGMHKNGWAFSISGSGHYTTMATIPGTFNDGLSYFISIDKKISDRHLLSLAIFGAMNSSGKHSAILKESESLTGNTLYNPNWGYQNGRVRNANIAGQHQPVILLTYEYRFSNQKFLQTSVAVSQGYKNSTGLDWYHAPDPRPDYYRYLPSFQTNILLKDQVAAAIQNDVNNRQVNWDELYNVNRMSVEKIFDADGIAGNTVSGKRARYIVENRVTQTKRIYFSGTYHGRFGDAAFFDMGLNMQMQASNYYKTISDLLGADFYVNWNQFAELDFPNDMNAMQNDLAHPNRILKKGDRFGYDYKMVYTRGLAWMQAMVSRRRFNFYLGAEMSVTRFWRVGNTNNGLFPQNSMGESKRNIFLNNSVKTGLSYAINGRQSLYFSASALTRPPNYDNVFVSPRTRNTQQDNAVSENGISGEIGYVLQAPKIKFRATGYYLVLRNGMDVLSFYHDAYNSFVNYAISGIGQTHCGFETGLEVELLHGFSLQAVAVNGTSYFNSRQFAVVTADNTSSEIEKVLIYAKNYKAGSAPQAAYSLGFNYRNSSRWFLNINTNFFDQQWMGWNPIRRTAEAVFPLDPNSEKGMQLLQQERMPPQYLVNLFLSHPFNIGRKKIHQWVWNIGINNLLNKKDMVISSYEQLRFDFDNKDANKFPPKYLYGSGLNFLISMVYRI